MKKILLFGAVLLVLASCVETKKGEAGSETDSLAEVGMTQMVVGTVGDGTSMHSLEFLGQSGDTLYFVYENNAVGGLACGDLISVEYAEVDGELNAQHIVNLTALCNSWVASDKFGSSYLTLEQNGRASYVGSDFPYKKWAISDGYLYLTKDDADMTKDGDIDKFDIVLLTEDSLLLQMMYEGDSIIIPFAKTDNVPVF
jgi:hypothetical protein